MSEPRIGQGKPGPGRPKGSTNKRSRLTRSRSDAGMDADELLQACFDVVRDPDARRSEVIAAAATALPYFRPKYSSVEITGGTDESEPVRIRVFLDDRNADEAAK